MMMSLGTFLFELSTLAYQQLQRQMQWRYASSDRVGARAAHQFLGVGDETIELTGLLVPDFAGLTAALDALRAMANTGRPYPLVDGIGTVLGSYVLTAINATHTLFARNGIAKRIEFSIALKRVDVQTATAMQTQTQTQTTIAAS